MIVLEKVVATRRLFAYFVLTVGLGYFRVVIKCLIPEKRQTKYIRLPQIGTFSNKNVAFAKSKKMGQLPLAMAAAIKRDLRAFQTKPSKWLFDIVVCNRHCVHVFFLNILKFNCCVGHKLAER